jgi:hypothetical protein
VFPVPGLGWHIENAVADHFPNRSRDDFINQRIRQLVEHVVVDGSDGIVEPEAQAAI